MLFFFFSPSCSYFCLSACHITWFSLRDITLCSINKSFICHSGYCAFYLFQLWGTLLFSLLFPAAIPLKILSSWELTTCCHTIMPNKKNCLSPFVQYFNVMGKDTELSTSMKCTKTFTMTFYRHWKYSEIVAERILTHFQSSNHFLMIKLI